MADKEEVTIHPAHELNIENIFPTKKKVTIALLRHLYGLPLFDAEGPNTVAGWVDVTVLDWADLCVAADGFGIKSLLKLAVENLDVSLRSLLHDVQTVQPRGPQGPGNADVVLFVGALMYKELHDRIPAAEKLPVRVCCEHYIALRKH